jgi:glycosyltransferase involved in cell wall biosynthesis
LGFLNATPRSFIDTFSPELANKIERIILSNKIDLVIASQVDMAAYGQYFQKLPAIFEEAEIGVLFEQYKNALSLSQRLRHWLTWSKHKRYLTAILKHFDAATVVSQPEKDLLSQAVTRHPRIHVIPNGVDVDSYRDVRETRTPNTMIFTGAFSYHPNYEAMEWFVGNVLPIIHEKIPSAELTITGDHRNLPLPEASNIVLTGFVDHIYPLIAKSACSVVPILSGGGTRLKILEAIALGAPVITTSKGVEGLALQAGSDILIADQPQEFADAVINVLSNSEIQQRLADNALKSVKEKYDWSKILPNFLELTQKVAASS